MEAKYKVGDKVNINHDNGILQVEVFGVMKNNLEKEPFYSLRSDVEFYFLGESDIIEKSNE